MNKYLANSVALVLLWNANLALAQKYQATPEERLTIKVSKSGLNRISNFPYQIVQVTGDDSTFRIKSDEDGKNIYLMPLAPIGEKIEVSIKNNAGFVQDLELEVASIKGRSIQIVNVTATGGEKQREQQVLSRMLRSMRNAEADRFYVQNTKNVLGGINGLNVVQTKLYKWQDLAGGVFSVTNNTCLEHTLSLEDFVKRFDNVLTSFVTGNKLLPRQTAHIFIIQKVKG